jgi:hypothetical protein
MTGLKGPVDFRDLPAQLKSVLLGRFDGARSLGSGGAAGEGQQGDVARALDGNAEPSLVTRADASHSARQNLAALLDKLSQDVRALVVDEVHLLDAELANFFLPEILTLAAPRTAGTTTRTTGTPFTPSAGTAFATATPAPAAWRTPATTATALAGLRRSRSLRLFLFL